MTVHGAFEQFKSQLELPDRRQAEAAAAQQKIRERLAAHLYVPRSFLTGSYSRYTKIHPLNDIDVFLVRNDQRVPLSTDGNGVLPSAALDEVATAVAWAYPSAQVKKQSRSVNVSIPGVAFGFDLVPAWYRTPDGYWIPDVDAGQWLPSDPEAHATALTSANDRCDRKLVPLIKMVKHWSRNNLDLFRSFHLELLCQAIISGPIASWQIGMTTVLKGLSSYVGKSMLDPVYRQYRVDMPLSADEQIKLASRIVYDANNASQALALEAVRNDSAAIAKWRDVFLSGF